MDGRDMGSVSDNREAARLKSQVSVTYTGAASVLFPHPSPPKGLVR